MELCSYPGRTAAWHGIDRLDCSSWHVQRHFYCLKVSDFLGFLDISDILDFLIFWISFKLFARYYFTSTAGCL